MTRVKAFIGNHSMLSYFALTFGLSWGCVFMAIGPGGILGASELSETMLGFVYVAMLVGPAGAAFLLTGLLDGRAGLRDLLSRSLRWRVGVRWYAIALLTAPLAATAVLLPLAQASPVFLPSIFTADDKATLLLTSIALGLLVGIFEELGWTGFAVPKLRLHYSILTSGLIVGLVWGAWHFVVFRETDSFYRALPLALLLARLFAWLPAYRILMVWVYDRTESLLVVILMHMSLVAGQFILVPQTLTGMGLLTWILVWAAALWVVVGVVAVANGGYLSRPPLQRTMNTASS